MHDRFDKLRKNDKSVSQETGVKYLILPVLIVILLVVAALNRPHTLNWIAQAVEAEFGGPLAPLVPSPTQLAQPAAQPHETSRSLQAAAYGAQR